MMTSKNHVPEMRRLKVGKKLRLLGKIFAGMVASFAHGGVPVDFEGLPYLPKTIDLARDSYDEKVIRAPYSSFVNEFLKEIHEENGQNIFDVGNSEVAWVVAPAPGDHIAVSKLRCRMNIECIVFTDGFTIYLATFTKEYENLIEYSLVFARDGYMDSAREQWVRRRTLYTEFGEMGSLYEESWFNDLEESGIFCSYIEDREKQTSVSYKRRITERGFIESKKIDDWRDCKAPW